MRTIKFRGKCIKSGDWVHGDLIHGVGSKFERMYILPRLVNLAYVKHCDPLDGVEVHPETVGQFTGLLDKDGKEIYEFDHFGNTQHYVYFYQGGFYLGGVPLIGYFNGKCIEQLHDVKGTIHDNPELL